MKLFYKILIIPSVIISSIIILFISFFTWKIPFNNVRLMIFQHDFNKSINKLNPNQSILIAEIAEVDNWADGTYCEFLAGQLRSSTLSMEEIEKIYPYDFFTAGVYFFDINYEENYGTLWHELNEKYLKNYKTKKGENIYLVWKSKVDYNTNGDIRCD